MAFIIFQRFLFNWGDEKIAEESEGNLLISYLISFFDVYDIFNSFSHTYRHDLHTIPAWYPETRTREKTLKK